MAKDPIKFHFNKILEIYLEDAEERSIKTDEEIKISDLAYYQLKQKILKAPIEDVLNTAEREGKLPFGPFKEVSQRKLMSDLKDIHTCLKMQWIDPSSIFEIEFSSACLCPRREEGNRWIVPPVVIPFEENYQLSIIGKIPLVSARGMIVMGKNSFTEMWKVWPQFLLYCCAVTRIPEALPAALIPIFGSEVKPAFFEDPMPLLKEYLRYYALCLKNFSPLLPDFIPFFLKEDAEGLHAKMLSIDQDPHRSYQNPYHRWIFNGEQTTSTQHMIASWKELAKRLAEEVMQHWFPEKQRSND